MTAKRNGLLAVMCCILLVAGFAAAGEDPGANAKAEKKACPADCEKPCCKEKKSCPADCQKACCKKADSDVSLGAAAPDFTAKDINGKDVQLSKLKDKIVVLEWANYDCPFVKAHYADDVMTTANLAKKYADKGVVWLTVNSTHYATAETDKKWAEEKNLPQTVLVGSSGKVGKLFKATNTPQLFIVDKAGNLAYRGAIDNAPLGKTPDSGYVNYVDKALSELTAGKEVSMPETKPYGCSVKYARK